MGPEEMATAIAALRLVLASAAAPRAAWVPPRLEPQAVDGGAAEGFVKRVAGARLGRIPCALPPAREHRGRMARQVVLDGRLLPPPERPPTSLARIGHFHVDRRLAARAHGRPESQPVTLACALNVTPGRERISHTRANAAR
jgi:hypothetical protein